MNATATWSNGTLTVTVDGATEVMGAKKPHTYIVAGTGNEWTESGIWMQRTNSAAAAAKIRAERGGVVITTEVI